MYSVSLLSAVVSTVDPLEYSWPCLKKISTCFNTNMSNMPYYALGHIVDTILAPP